MHGIDRLTFDDFNDFEPGGTSEWTAYVVSSGSYAPPPEKFNLLNKKAIPAERITYDNWIMNLTNVSFGVGASSQVPYFSPYMTHNITLELVDDYKASIRDTLIEWVFSPSYMNLTDGKILPISELDSYAIELSVDWFTKSGEIFENDRFWIIPRMDNLSEVGNYSFGLDSNSSYEFTVVGSQYQRD